MGSDPGAETGTNTDLEMDPHSKGPGPVSDSVLLMQDCFLPPLPGWQQLPGFSTPGKQPGVLFGHFLSMQMSL